MGLLGEQKENHLGMLVYRLAQGRFVNGVGFGEAGLVHRHVVHSGGHAVHTEGGRQGHHVVVLRLAECLHQQVDDFIAAVAQKDVFRRNVFHLG